MSRGRADEQVTQDAALTVLMRAVVASGHQKAVLECLSDQEQRAVVAVVERHATRRGSR